LIAKGENAMKHAISELEKALEIYRENEKINRRNGNDKQADLEKEIAADIVWAINVLRK